MQTKTDLVDFVSGTWFLNRKDLYKIDDSMGISMTNDEKAREKVAGRFEAFKEANAQLAKTRSLLPDAAADELVPYDAAPRPPATVEDDDAPDGLYVKEVRVPESAKLGALKIEITFADHGETPPPSFVPLAVLMTDDAKELSESYGKLEELTAGSTVRRELEINTKGAVPGRYFLAVIPSHPDTGKPVGAGKYKVPVLLTN